MTADDDRSLRVLYVARAPFVSGAERALEAVLRGLDPRPRQVTPALVVGADNELAAAARGLGMPVTVVPLPKRSRWGVVGWWRSLARLRRVIGAFRPDVLHANDVPSCQAVSVLGAELGIARVIHLRWTITAADAAWWAPVGAEALICISQWMRGQLGDTAATSLARARVEVLHDAVGWVGGGERGAKSEERGARGLSPFAQSAEQRGTDPLLGDQHGGQHTESRALTLGFAGQLIASKGLDLVIEALGRLEAEARPRLVVAGEDTQRGGAYRRELEELARRAGVAERITWLGFSRAVGSDVYQKVDAVVCPSREEPLGLVPLEAAQHGVPAVACRCGGLCETIADGQTGWLVEPTVEAWAAALADLTQRKRGELAAAGAAARERTARLYSMRGYQERLVKLYEEVRKVGR